MALRILLIDDEPLVRRALARQLRPDVVVEADGGEQALDICRDQGPFDGILCDLLMRGMDGVEFLSRLRELDPSQAERVVILSGSPGQARVPLDSLGVRYEDKPISPATLRDVVAGWKD